MRRYGFIGVIAIGVIGLTNFAHAMNLDPKGLGQVLIYPYYTVNKGQDTYFSVTNNSFRGIVA